MLRKRRSDKKQVGTSADKLDSDVLCAMSNAEILNKIEKLMTPPPGEDINTETVERYLALLQERAPVMKEYDPAAQWEKLMDKHPLLVSESTVHGRLSKVESSRRAGRWGGGFRIMRMVDIAVAVVLCLVITANALKVNPIQAVLNWAEGVIQVYSNPSGIMELPANDPSEYHSLEEALLANGIESSGLPTWVPKDYTLSLVTVRKSDAIARYTATFESKRGELVIRVTQHYIGNTASAEERENGGYEYSNNNGTYYIVSNLSLSKAGWQVESNSYAISGQISEEELIKIIDSIACI